jgi:hypothetical protein
MSMLGEVEHPPQSPAVKIVGLFLTGYPSHSSMSRMAMFPAGPAALTGSPTVGQNRPMLDQIQ